MGQIGNGNSGNNQSLTPIQQMLTNAGYSLGEQRKSRSSSKDRNKLVKDLVNKIPMLNHYWYKLGGDPGLYTSSSKPVNEFSDGGSHHSITLNDDTFSRGYEKILGSLFHELYHAYQYVSGHQQDVKDIYGSVSKGSIGRAILEIEAYRFAIELGDPMNSYTKGKFQGYLNQINTYKP